MEIKLTEDKREELQEEFETTKILSAIDILDKKIRPVLSDNNLGGPPEIRDKLMELHEVAHNVINLYNTETDKGLFFLAHELENELSDIIEELEKIRKVAEDISNFAPEYKFAGEE